MKRRACFWLLTPSLLVPPCYSMVVALYHYCLLSVHILTMYITCYHRHVWWVSFKGGQTSLLLLQPPFPPYTSHVCRNLTRQTMAVQGLRTTPPPLVTRTATASEHLGHCGPSQCALYPPKATMTSPHFFHLPQQCSKRTLARCLNQ